MALATALLLAAVPALAQEPVRPVLTVTAHARSIATFGPFIGSVEARYQTNLGFQVGGRIIAREVNVGDQVKQGQRLSAVDATLLRLAVQSAQADLANAKAQLANAVLTENRSKTLAVTETASKAQVDTATAARETAQAKVAQSEASLRQAQNVLSYAELIAPYDGVITAVNSDVGKVVSAGDVIVTLARPDVREAVVDVPDYLAPELQAYPRFDVTLAGEASIKAGATLRQLAPASDAVTRTRRARLPLDNPPQGFRLGSTIAVSAVRTVAPFIEVPRSALVGTGDKLSVWIVDPGKSAVTTRPVTLVTSRDGYAVVDGLHEGDVVVTAGVDSLQAGQAVKLPAAAISGDKIPEGQQ
ncbi:efflux RND transporter periplasmic adaptor subunit [Labrys monachus]|uniref:RND family efflux transporter MFP subunit n=1 Tax=Labrys monachus TaxID=217067 RepID=A0ABU0F8C1_9HYPH|nr:efflux RND transporter periplasmic adaptor subunit [Labrys monachus]MDQ0390786.1 RND family efflux transporter MFP subunit [Labrys monachus]